MTARGRLPRVMMILTRESSVEDACPMCGATLGVINGPTRRRIVLCATPGVFRWRCPDCSGLWEVRPAPPLSLRAPA